MHAIIESIISNMKTEKLIMDKTMNYYFTAILFVGLLLLALCGGPNIYERLPKGEEGCDENNRTRAHSI